jgi:hypothetical protein
VALAEREEAEEARVGGGWVVVLSMRRFGFAPAPSGRSVNQV